MKIYLAQEEDDRERMLTPLYLIKFQEKDTTPEIESYLQKWGLVERRSKRSNKLTLTDKGLKKTLDASIVLADD